MVENKANPLPSAPLIYSESIGISVSDSQLLSAQELELDSIQNVNNTGWQSRTPSGLYDRTQVFAGHQDVKFKPDLTTITTPVQGIPIDHIPIVGSTTFITVDPVNCQECFQRREAKRIRELNSRRDVMCCYCPAASYGRDCGANNSNDHCALICLLVCCLGMLFGFLCYLCCREKEQEICSTCGSNI